MAKMDLSEIQKLNNSIVLLSYYSKMKAKDGFLPEWYNVLKDKMIL